MTDKLQSLHDAMATIESWKQNGKKIVFTNGCFDLFHAGHVTYLDHARSLGDYLVIGLNSDESVAAIKGPDRPIITHHGRAMVLAGLTSVDLIVLFSEPDPIQVIDAIKPDIHVKGGDYDSPEQLPEYPTVLKHGGTVQILPFLPGFSSSQIISKIGSEPGLFSNNDPTMIVDQWLKKEAYSRDHWQYMTQECLSLEKNKRDKAIERLSDTLKSFHRKYQDAVVKKGNLLAEFLDHAFSKVNWKQIATDMIDNKS